MYDGLHTDPERYGSVHGGSGKEPEREGEASDTEAYAPGDAAPEGEETVEGIETALRRLASE